MSSPHAVPEADHSRLCPDFTHHEWKSTASLGTTRSVANREPKYPRDKLWWGIAALAVAGGLIFAALTPLRVIPGGDLSTKDEPERLQKIPTLKPQSVPSPGPPAARAEAPSVPSPEDNERVSSASSGETRRPTCTEDTDCKTAKWADCVRHRCASGTCRHDRSACECDQDGDCDDQNDCTRDVCFRNTLKCIHIAQDCAAPVESL